MARAKKVKPSLSDRWMEIARKRGMTEQPPAATRSGKLLWSLLEDASAAVRTSAAFALAQLRDPSLVQAFILALEGASSPRMAKAAITLGEAGYVNAVPYFAAGLSKTDKKLSAALARGLGLLADPSVAPLLIDALEQDFVPAEAAEALGRLGDTRAAPALVRALEHKKDTVRAAAAYSLGCLGTLSEADERQVLEKLTGLSSDASKRVKLCAAVARFERGDPQAQDAIRAALG
jgi:HEAT repeat protein